MDNVFQNVDDTGIMIVGSNVQKKDIYISGNTIDSYQVPIWVESDQNLPTKDIQILGNEVSSGIDVGIQLDDVTQFTVSDNIVEDCGAAGIVLFDSKVGVISSNQVLNNGKVWKEYENGVLKNYNDGIRLSSRRDEGTRMLLYTITRA